MSSGRVLRTRYSVQSSCLRGLGLPSTFARGKAKRTSRARSATKPTMTPAGKTA